MPLIQRKGTRAPPPTMKQLANLFEQAKLAKQDNKVKSMSLKNIHKVVSSSTAFETKVLHKKPNWINGEKRASVPVRVLKGDKNGKQTESYLINLQQGRKHNTKLLNHVSKLVGGNKEIKAVTKIQALARSYLARKKLLQDKKKKKAKKLS